MENSKLSPFLLRQISFHQDSAEIICKFHQVYGKSCFLDLLEYRRQLLHAAREYKHDELLVLLLADTHCDVEPFIKIKILRLRKLISQWLAVKIEKSSGITCEDTGSGSCASVLHQNEIFRLLISSNKDQNLEGIWKLLAVVPDMLNNNHECGSPLHLLMLLGKECYHGERRLALPEIVKLVIDRGACVNEQNSNGLTPLSMLMEGVKDMMSSHTDIATEGRRIIVETTRVLLHAGCRTDGQPGQEPLEHLLSHLSFVSSGCCKSVPHVHAHVNQFLLITNLIEMLLTFGAKPPMCRTYVDVLMKAVDVLRAYESKSHFIAVFDSAYSLKFCEDPFDSIMSSFADIFRYFFLAEAGVKDTNESFCRGRRDHFGINTLNSGVCERDSNFMCFNEASADLLLAFAKIYSSHADRSNGFIKLILNTLTMRQVAFLKQIISKLSTLAEPSTSSEILNLLNDLVVEIEPPFRLQHLSRRFIIEIMSRARLFDASNIRLPGRLQEYVLLKL